MNYDIRSSLLVGFKIYMINWNQLIMRIWCYNSIEIIKGFSALLLLFNFDICVKSYSPSKCLFSLSHIGVCVWERLSRVTEVSREADTVHIQNIIPHDVFFSLMVDNNFVGRGGRGWPKGYNAYYNTYITNNLRSMTWEVNFGLFEMTNP